jgi:hypothetical protein
MFITSSYNGHYTMGRNNVPELAVLHCNGRIMRQCLPNRLRSRTLVHSRIHTLAPSILSLLEAPAEGFFRNLSGFGRRIRFDVLHGLQFQSVEQPKVTGTKIWRLQWLSDDRNCCTISDM